MINTTANYRYPGSSPFQDTDHDRRLFFGRDQEKESLLHLVLAENLVILFAKSGMGKTSLLNAGLLQPLRDRDFLPLMLRFHDPTLDPLQAVYTGIKDIVQRQGLEYTPGEENTLWHYFKTAEFWSAEDILLTPVLIFDQFEEFFTLHSPERRKPFITQLADLLRGRVPKELQESAPSESGVSYSETRPGVKIMIAIREDFLGQLEEMSRELSDILQNRFRLIALTREQAKKAIVEPARLEDRRLTTKSFQYAPDTVEMMLDFLCKQRKRSDLSMVTDEIEPFQLQLVCQHVENEVRQKSEHAATEVIVQKEDLGGEEGMLRVLEDFYDNQMKRLEAKLQKCVRKLCEEGFISSTNRRLSLEEEEITRRFKVAPALLAELVNSRLLRAEPRVGSVYYELSHDTLIEPIRTSQKKLTARRKMFRGIVTLTIVIVLFGLTLYFSQMVSKIYSEPEQLKKEGKYAEAVEKYHHLLTSDNLFLKGYKYYRRIIHNEHKDAMLTAQVEKAYREWGQACLEQNKPDEAIKAYQQAIEHNIKNAEIYYKLGKILSNQGELDEAIKNYRESILIAPAVEAYAELGQLYMKQEKLDDASKVYQEAIEKKITNADMYYQLGKVFSAQGKEKIKEYMAVRRRSEPEQSKIHKDLSSAYREYKEFQEAIKNYELSLRLDNKNADVYKELALLYVKQKEFDQAVEVYQRASKASTECASIYADLAKAFKEEGTEDYIAKVYEIASHVDSQEASYYRNLGATFYELGNYEKVTENYRKAIELDPQNVYSYNILGIALAQQGKINEAIEIWQKAIQTDPNYAPPYNNLGDTFRTKDKYDEAIELYHKAMKINPTDTYICNYAYRGLGYTFLNQNKYDEGIANFQRAIQLDLKDSDAYTGLGNALANQGKYDEAIINYQKAIELDPKAVYAYNFLGIALGQQGKINEAIEIWQKAIQTDPNYAPPYNNLGDMLRNQGKYDEAIVQYHKAIEIDPTDTYICNYAYRGLGYTFLNQNKYDEAIANFQRATQLDPKDSSSYAGLGNTFGAQGKYDEAIVNYRKALELDPNYVYVYNGLGEVLFRQDKYDTTWKVIDKIAGVRNDGVKRSE
jgi:tetratricopeptide (TPR) repeat protein